jgi:hypothetical protein
MSYSYRFADMIGLRLIWGLGAEKYKHIRTRDSSKKIKSGEMGEIIIQGS